MTHPENDYLDRLQALRDEPTRPAAPWMDELLGLLDELTRLVGVRRLPEDNEPPE